MAELVYRYQGSPEVEGDCGAVYQGIWSCTLNADHRYLHEAWGTCGEHPCFVWGSPRDPDDHG